MVWAALVAVGVAVVSMTLFGARITRRPSVDHIVDDLDADPDPSDPWAAWRPRPFDEMDRPRPRVWPVLAAFTGLVMVGAGFAGARQTLWTTPAATAGVVATPQAYTVEVDIPATPSPKPTPTPAPATPAPTPKPQVATPAPTPSSAATPVPTGAGPSISSSASCQGGIRVNYSATASAGSTLRWLAVYMDGKVVKGGPISGSSHSGSYQAPPAAGDHDLEVSVEDSAGRTSRRQHHVTC